MARLTPPLAPVAPAVAADVIVDPLKTSTGTVVTRAVPLEAVVVEVTLRVLVWGAVALYTACCTELMSDSASAIRDEYGASGLAVI